MQAELVRPFLESLLSVYNTMVGVELRPGTPSIKSHSKASGVVTSFILLSSPQTNGSLSISFDQGIAIETMSRLLGEAPQDMNDEVLDMVGEIANMVAGGAKHLLEEQGYDFGLNSPSMLNGEPHDIIHPGGGSVLQLMLNSDFGAIGLEISIQA